MYNDNGDTSFMLYGVLWHEKHVQNKHTYSSEWYT